VRVRPDVPTLRTSTAKWRLVAAYSLSPGIIVVMYIFFFSFPEFYETYIFSPSWREHQAIELVTFASSLAGGCILTYCSIVLVQRSSSSAAHRIHWGSFVLGCAGVGSLFLAGEEINWGQVFVHWESPSEALNLFGQVRVHKTVIPNSFFHTVATIFILCLFGIVPLLWAKARRIMPPSLAPCIPTGPCILAGFIALLWDKDVLNSELISALQRWLGAEPVRSLDVFVHTEQKEMLVSVALLLYSAYCAGRVIELRQTSTR
jgi:hypothetical protein